MGTDGFWTICTLEKQGVRKWDGWKNAGVKRMSHRKMHNICSGNNDGRSNKKHYWFMPKCVNLFEGGHAYVTLTVERKKVKCLSHPDRSKADMQLTVQNSNTVFTDEIVSAVPEASDLPQKWGVRQKELEGELDKLRRENSRLRRELAELRDQNELIQKQLNRKNEQSQILLDELTEMHKQLENSESACEKLECQQRDQDQKTKQLAYELKILNQQKSKLEAEMKEMEELRATTENKLHQLQNRYDAYMEQCKTERQRFEEKLSNERKHSDQLMTQLAEARRGNEQQSLQNRRHNQLMNKQRDAELEELRKQIEEMLRANKQRLDLVEKNETALAEQRKTTSDLQALVAKLEGDKTEHSTRFRGRIAAASGKLELGQLNGEIRLLSKVRIENSSTKKTAAARRMLDEKADKLFFNILIDSSRWMGKPPPCRGAIIPVVSYQSTGPKFHALLELICCTHTWPRQKLKPGYLIVRLISHQTQLQQWKEHGAASLANTISYLEQRLHAKEEALAVSEFQIHVLNDQLRNEEKERREILEKNNNEKAKINSKYRHKIRLLKNRTRAIMARARSHRNLLYRRLVYMVATRTQLKRQLSEKKKRIYEQDYFVWKDSSLYGNGKRELIKRQPIVEQDDKEIQTEKRIITQRNFSSGAVGVEAKAKYEALRQELDASRNALDQLLQLLDNYIERNIRCAVSEKPRSTKEAGHEVPITSATDEIRKRFMDFKQISSRIRRHVLHPPDKPCVYPAKSLAPELFIVIIGSMTPVFNTDASLPYNHDLFESLTVKKRIKHDLTLCGCKVYTKGRNDFGQFIQKHMRLLLLFEYENDVVCIFQIDKVFVTGYLNTGVLETFRRSSFNDYEVKSKWRELASLTDTTLRTEAFRELAVYSHTSGSHHHRRHDISVQHGCFAAVQPWFI
ncbi:hypothetical protein CLF_100297 [Clonorchis sinensis]|uniref:Uncharacterized protein n=1 Tax=Clonorchis sinensis TaxID=79923 RepID=G7Y350_CLOSI|nr:hypothetical protein CLF_100297 [Clonorchis sinensis]